MLLMFSEPFEMICDSPACGNMDMWVATACRGVLGRAFAGHDKRRSKLPLDTIRREFCLAATIKSAPNHRKLVRSDLKVAIFIKPQRKIAELLSGLLHPNSGHVFENIKAACHGISPDGHEPWDSGC